MYENTTWGVHYRTFKLILFYILRTALPVKGYNIALMVLVVRPRASAVRLLDSLEVNNTLSVFAYLFDNMGHMMKIATIRFTAALFLLLITSSLLLADQNREIRKSNYPEGVLPRWQTLEELRNSSNLMNLDELTPAPDNMLELPAEFEPQQGIIMRYPYYFSDIFAGMVDAFQTAGTIHMLVANQAAQNDCIDTLAAWNVPIDSVNFIQVETDAIWVRDYGPWFGYEADTLAVVDLLYYGGRPNDDFIPNHLHDMWDMAYYGPNIHHEGGNMITDGHGSMFMTTRVNEANPGMSDSQIRDIYREYFGQNTTHIFQRIQHDGTGHIDLWAKMTNDSTFLVAQMPEDDDNYDLIEAHAARLDTIRTHNGGTYNIVRCPMPELAFSGGPYYRSYINSTSYNNVVAVPIYGLELDDEALAAYAEAYGPDWTIIGVDCNEIAPLGGAIHCTSIGVPVPKRGDYQFRLSAADRLRLVDPGETAPFELTIRNTGLFNDTLDISVVSDNEDFVIDYTIPTGTVSEDSYLVLDVDSSFTSLVNVTTDNQHGSAGKITFTFSSRGLPEYSKTMVFDVRNSAQVMIINGDLDGDYEDYYTDAFNAAFPQESVTYSCWNNSETTFPAHQLMDADVVEVVLWYQGDSGVMSEEQRTALTSYLNEGRNMMLTGRGLNTAISIDMFGLLGVERMAIEVNLTHVEGVEDDLLGSWTSFDLGGDECADNCTILTSFEPSDDGIASYFYNETDAAAIRTDNATYRSIIFAFPFEAISTSAERSFVMLRSINYLLNNDLGVDNETSDTSLPTEFAVYPNVPNPFNPSTMISFDTPVNALIKVTVYDVLGREVTQLLHNNLEAGHHSIQWNALDVASGIYFYRLEATGKSIKFSDTQKMLLVK
jgi:agmatine/peptidylarginine deiminase